MTIFDEIVLILKDILDIEGQNITPGTYLIRELGAESIDLIELSVTLNARFHVQINDDEIFLNDLRMDIREAQLQGVKTATFLAVRFPWLSEDRLLEIVADIPGGPTLKIRDIIAYLDWHIKKSRDA